MKGNFSLVEVFAARYFGALVMYFVSKRLKKKHGIQDERLSLYEAIDIWVSIHLF